MAELGTSFPLAAVPSPPVCVRNWRIAFQPIDLARWRHCCVRGMHLNTDFDERYRVMTPIAENATNEDASSHDPLRGAIPHAQAITGRLTRQSSRQLVQPTIDLPALPGYTSDRKAVPPCALGFVRRYAERGARSWSCTSSSIWAPGSRTSSTSPTSTLAWSSSTGLVAGLTTESRLFKLVSAIVRLCGELDAKVVAGASRPPAGSTVIAAGPRGWGHCSRARRSPPPPIAWPDRVTATRARTQRVKKPW